MNLEEYTLGKFIIHMIPFTKVYTLVKGWNITVVGNIILIAIMLFAIIYLSSIPVPLTKYGPRIKIDDEIVSKATVTTADAEYIKKETETIESAERRAAWLRIVNPICSNCFWKPKELKASDFLVCKDCLCTQYCSEACKKTHEKEHSLWCCQKDADRDMGAQQLVKYTVGTPLENEGTKEIEKWLLRNKIGITYEELVKCPLNKKV